MAKRKKTTGKSTPKKRRNNDLLIVMTEYCRIVPGVRITKSKRLFHPTNFEYDEAGRTFIITNMMIAMSNLGFSPDSMMEIFDPVDLRSQRFVEGTVGEMSQKFMAIRLRLNDIVFNIVLNGGAKTSGTSARLKESMTIYFITHPELVDVSINNYSGCKDWKTNHLKCKSNLRNSLLLEHVQGIS